ncbi:hypothetical protein CesoFtcFv8_025345 [Champsocephalus esox]|uniref:Uncharacterized protein n=1 Tax=Champsocephalus esox TaxID=159716 RepID=A0AAN8GCG7_9TELE|nr:hypothetical protein CesoFtcFv8_025345 [Champsocephalus esox]
MLGLRPAERAAFWEAVSCGQGLWGDAVWLIGLSWPAHKAFCPELIHPALHGEMERGEGHHGGVFWGWESPISSPSLYSVQGEAATFKQLGSNTTKTLAEAAKCWQSAAQHWKKHPQSMTPGTHLDTGTSCWA